MSECGFTGCDNPVRRELTLRKGVTLTTCRECANRFMTDTYRL